MKSVGVRAYRAAQAAFAGAWIVLSWPWMTGAVTIPYDAKAHFQAQLQFLANALHSGQSPFWAPNVFVGLPQIADPQSLIFSPALLLAWLDPAPSFRQLDLYVLGLLALAGLAVIKLFQDRGWHPAGAAVAAIAVAFGGSAAWRIQHIGQVQSYAFFCITLWLLLRALGRRSPAWGAAAGLAGGVMIAEPDQVSFLACYVLAGAVVAFWVGGVGIGARVRQSLPVLAVAGVAGLLVAALPLLFTVLFVMSSNRPGIPFAEAVRGSLHPASLLTAIVGDLFGAFDQLVDYWGPYSETWDPTNLTLSQNMSQLYAGGVPALLLLVVGLGWGRLWDRDIRFFTLALAANALYALGVFTPLFRIAYTLVPGVGMFRRPADATFLVDGLVAICAGYLLHVWLGGAQPDKGTPRRMIIPAVLVTLPFALAIWVAVAEGKLGLAVRPILMAVGWLGAGLVFLALMRRWVGAQPLAAVAIAAAVMTLDLRINNGPNESTALAAEAYDVLRPQCRNETVRFLRTNVRRGPGSAWRDRVEMVGLGFEWPNIALVHGIDHTLGYNPLRMEIVSRAVGAGDYIAGPDQRTFSPLFPSYDSPLADMLGLRYVLASVPITDVDHKLHPGRLTFVRRTAEAYIYENPRALPRVMVVREARAANFDAITRLGRWPAFDSRRTVLLETPQRQAASGGPSLPGAVEDSARIVRYENTVVEIAVTAGAAGYLVLNDLWHPWWRASVDGRDATILKANVMFRAVRIPAGRHTVRFEFHPLDGSLDELAAKVRRLLPDGHAKVSLEPRARATNDSTNSVEGAALRAPAPHL
ncbi:MAG: hypothetical protein R3D68_10425 [Hyphomicrobiaceae bacterium]